MTAPNRRSRGLAHSLAIKRSPGFARYQAERKAPPPTTFTPEEEREQAERAAGSWRRKRKPDPMRFLEILGYDAARIRQKLSEYYRRGYVQALRDVKRERERMEVASYEAALGSVTMQEAVAFSHRYDPDHR